MKTKRLILAAGAILTLGLAFSMHSGVCAVDDAFSTSGAVVETESENPATLDATPFLLVLLFASASLTAACLLINLKARR